MIVYAVVVLHIKVYMYIIRLRHMNTNGFYFGIFSFIQRASSAFFDYCVFWAF